MSFKLHHMHGGMHLQQHKQKSCAQPVQVAELPRQLILPLRQHIGEANKPIVAVGERVLRGQLIATSPSPISAGIHASSSGLVSAIETHAVPHPSQLSADCIIIDTNGKDEAIKQTPIDLSTVSRIEILEYLHDSGIAGLGGAVFPTSAKLSRALEQSINTLIINGAECEPYITCDDMLMRTRSAAVIQGISHLQTILSPARTLIAIEDNKPEAIDAMRQSLLQQALTNTELVVIPTIYPCGGEKQLIQILSGHQIPQHQLAFDIGTICQNVGTCAAISDALERQQPLISRYVTVSGDGICNPGNWEVRLGTPIRHLINLAGGYRAGDANQQHLVMGGPMMGFSLATDSIPVVKASNNILVMQAQTIASKPGLHDECIRCGKCSEVCPAQLLPQQLYWHARAKAYDKAESYNLFDCIECGCCSAVCPSEIPLVQYYRAAKSELRASQQALFKSDRARIRFESREKRLLRKKQQQEESRRLKREALLKKSAQKKQQDTKPDPVQAALDRIKAKNKENIPEIKNVTNLTPDQQKQIDEADARRRAARESRA